MRRPFFPTIAVIVIGAAGCLEGERHTVERTLTSTVTLSRESFLDVNLPIPVLLDGTSRGDDVIITVELTVTASSSTIAARKADEIAIETKSEGGALSIRVTEPPRVTLGGACLIRLPGDLDVRVTERGGTVEVHSVDGQIEVNSISHVRITGAKDNVSVAIEAGNALVQTEAQPGKTTLVNISRGDIELTLPPAVSADIEADVVGTGNIVVSHPTLPRYPGGTLPYRQSVSGGLSVIRVQTGSGLIVIKGP